MGNIYRELLQRIQEGKACGIKSSYRGCGITRELICGENPGALESSLTLVQEEAGAVLTEYYTPKPRLIVLGGGHIALPLCQFGARAGFSVVVFDDRPSFANPGRFPEAAEVICDGFEHMGKRIGMGKHDYVVIVTRGHRHDSLCLGQVLAGELPRYVGMIGSKRRIAIVKQQMEEETGAREKLQKLHAPIGLPIGAVTPEEIAVSILAEVIREKRLGSGGFSSSGKIETEPDMELLRWLATDREEPAALATVVAASGSTPRETGAKMAVTPFGQVVGSIGGGCSEAGVIERARDILQNGGYCFVEVDLTDSAEEDGMVCGGTMKVLVEAV